MKSLQWTALAVLLAATLSVHAQETEDQPWYHQLDPQMQVVIDEFLSLNPKPIQTLTPAEARTQPSMTDAAKHVMMKDLHPMPLKVSSTKVTTIPGDNVKIPVKFYYPKGAGPFPVVVYYHGGGFVLASIATYDESARAICGDAKAIVMSVEYRKAPENKYPAAVDDAYSAYIWAVKNAKGFNGDPKRVAVVGESAGGNLATVVSMMAREKGFQMPVAEVLIYPVVNDDMTTPSYLQYAMAVPLNKLMMGWFFQYYLPETAAGSPDPHVTPFKGKLKGMPPTTIIAAEIDPLQSEGKMYADKLQAAGVAVDYKLYPGTTHEFFGMGKIVGKAKEAEVEVGTQLQMAFKK